MRLFTFFIALVSFILGFILGTILGLFKLSNKKYLSIPANIYTDIFRGTPIILQTAFIWYVVFGALPISPLVSAVITFSLNSAAYISEIIRSGIQNVDCSNQPTPS